MEFNTALLHTAFKGDNATGATLTPIYQSSAFAQESPEQLEKIFNNKAAGFSYTRISNPTVASFEARIAALEGGIAAVACSSGMAAVTLSLLNILSSGDEIIAGSGLFGGTIDLLGDLKSFGIKTNFVNHISAESIEPLINENTKAVFAELIGNPALDVVDIESVANLVHSKNIPLIIDSTTATPYLINPIKYGADIVVHSTSKYINGGGNSVSGIIVDSGNFKWDTERYPTLSEYKRFGKFAFSAKLRNGLWRNVGACLSPMNAFMNSVGLETLGLRMERLCYNARELAEILVNIYGISVNYPTLGEYGELVKKQFGGKGGAIITLRAGSKERAFEIIRRLRIPLIATNIGDVRTLVIHPASTIYAHASKEQRENAGVHDDTIRVSVGIEDIKDLKDDFYNAIKSIGG